MHFVTGGALNGKSRWVREYYNEKRIVFDHWVSGHHPDDLPKEINMLACQTIVIQGIEQFIKEDCLTMDMHTCREAWKILLDDWKMWEKSDPQRLLVIIGTDITKGIVPIEKTDRTWRDVTGWVFQDISSKADRVDVIWYGLNKQIK